MKASGKIINSEKLCYPLATFEVGISLRKLGKRSRPIREIIGIRENNFA
jgi:hypothetical protein